MRGSPHSTQQFPRLTTFTVILQAALNGSPSHTTRDAIDAGTCGDAEAKAVAAWRTADPTFTYSPLLTVSSPPSAAATHSADGRRRATAARGLGTRAMGPARSRAQRSRHHEDRAFREICEAAVAVYDGTEDQRVADWAREALSAYLLSHARDQKTAARHVRAARIVCLAPEHDAALAFDGGDEAILRQRCRPDRVEAEASQQ